MSEPRLQQSMPQIVSGLQTKSAKIRALHKAGYARSDIARFLGIRYQHVRNVLIQSQQRDTQASRSEEAGAKEWLQVAPDGRIVIPADYRRLLGVEHGGWILAVRDGDSLRLVSHARAIADLQERAAPYAAGGSMTDALIEERRREARKESLE